MSGGAERPLNLEAINRGQEDVSARQVYVEGYV
jgi:hypothetical protein